MKRPLLLLILATATVLHAAPQSGRRTAPRPAQPVPVQPTETVESEPPITTSAPLSFVPARYRERQIKALENGSFRLADFEGKVVVINLWASWCGPCRREVPDYEKVRKAYAGREIEFIGLTTEDPRTSSDRVNRFVDDTRFGFRLGWADRELAQTLMNGKGGIPQTLVLNRDGRIVDHWSGYSPRQSSSRLTETIDHAFSDESQR